ncbi:hypothetical protein F4604DRAFT_1698523 [Suillus subluteus]|nr:hypothetical protein F4604DRAFT_1698523 [Suillus subluteus]
MWCRFGCRCLEMSHHLFVECRRFAETRNKSSQEVFDSTSVLLREAKTMGVYLRSARRLFVDYALFWPIHTSRHYLGTVPAINGSARTNLTCIGDENVAYSEYSFGRSNLENYASTTSPSTLMIFVHVFCLLNELTRYLLLLYVVPELHQ